MRGRRLVAGALASLIALCSGIAFASQADSGLDPALSAPPSEAGTEIPSERTATSQTYSLPDGAREARIFSAPINYLDAEGNWQPIEEGLEEAGDGTLVNGANSFDLELPEDLGSEPVRLSTEGQWVATELLGADLEPVQLEDETASYESADGATSFDLNGMADGVKENIELDDPTQPSTFSFALSASAGLSAQLAEDGSVEFQDETGQAVVILPAPTMFDTEGMAPASAIHYELEARGEGHWLLEVEADREWLAQPERAWPVTIDPTLVVATATLDCMIAGKANQQGTGACGSGGQKTLTMAYSPALNSANDEWSRDLFRYSLKAIPLEAFIASVTFSAHSPEAALNTSGVELRETTKKWTSTANWLYWNMGEKPASWTNQGGDYSTELGTLSTSQRGSEAGWWNFPVSAGRVEQLAPREVNEGEKKIKEAPLEFIAKLLDDKVRECGSETCTQRRLLFESSTATLAENRPYLSVTYYPPASADSVVASPGEGTRSAKRFKLTAKWDHQGVTGVFFQYNPDPGPESRWVDIPTSQVVGEDGKAIEWPIAVEGGAHESKPVYWDATKALGPELVAKGHIRAVLVGAPGADGHTKANEVELNRRIGGAKDATAPIGPGAVDLLTGNFTVSRNDVSIPGFGSALEFSRTHSSRDAASGAKGVLGAGWKPGVEVEAAGGAEWRSVRLETATEEEENEKGEIVIVPVGEYALLTDLEGYEYAFEKVGESFVAPPEFSGWTLALEAGSFVLSDTDGNRTTFSNGTGGNEYLPVAVTQTGGSGNKTQMVYQLVSGARRLSMIIAPTAAGVSCTEANVKTTAGCRSLIFNYKPATAWGAPAELGDRLYTITYYGPTGPTTNSNWNVAQYAYNTEGRLIEAWDPRLSALKEAYTYEAGGQLRTITPPGEEPWTFEYGTYEEEKQDGRLISVKRPSLLASPTVAQTTVSYGVSLSGSGAPYDMSSSAVAQWGQKDVPTDATAIFPADEVPSSPPSSYKRASVFYLDAEGQMVNAATPSGAGVSSPSITTSEADEFGNVVRELGSQNRLRALAAGSESVARSHELETKRAFSADGTELQEEWGPLHQVRLESGSVVKARLHTTMQYDEGWPGTGLEPHLPTRVTTGASIPGQGTDADQRVSETKYDWTLRQPTETIVDPLGMKLTTRIAYDSTSGLPVERSLPAKPSGGDAHTTKTIYYSAGTSPDSACANNPGWANLPCKVMPAAQPGTKGQPEVLVTRFASYNQLGEATETIESPGGKEESTRKTITVYDTSGREKTRRQEGGGTALPKHENLYWPTTGRLKTQRLVCEVECEGFDAQAVTTTYDALGRMTAYLDADGKKSLYSYDLLGRPVSAYDTKGTQTMSYDSTSGLLTSLADTAAGTFTASYDADGNMVEEGLPNGLVAKTTYDEVGAPIGLSYTKIVNCSAECTWLQLGAERSIYGQVLSQSSNLSSQQYSYDKAGRLTLVKDTPQGGGCTTRAYGYDADSNRTALVTRAPGIGGACDTSSEGKAQSYSYDAADRLTAEGIGYDNFGRITALPGEYAGGGTLTTSYYTNDMVATQSQGGTTNAYKLDGALRPRELKVTGAKELTEVFHYAGESDAPAWVARGTAWTRYITGIGGELAAIQDSVSGTALQLADLHGDVVATASLSQSATKPTATFEYDEFGNPKAGSAGRFGWLGGKRRRTELPSGVIQMGARSYIPAMGRFLSADPVEGGSANAYEYGEADPVGNVDLDGLRSRYSGKRRRRELNQLVKIWFYVRKRIGQVAGANFNESDEVLSERLSVVVKRGFERAKPKFENHPSWGRACHRAYNQSWAEQAEYGPHLHYLNAVDACSNAVRLQAEKELRMHSKP